MIRLLALDLDGTLLNSRGRLSDRNRKALARARELGVRTALVTGRRFRDARPIALELGIDIPLISHNGALTKHARTLETVAVTLLPLETAREVLRVGRSAGGDALISDDPEGAGVMVYDHLSGDNPALSEYIRWARHIHGDDFEDAVRKVDSLEDYLDHAPLHVAFSGRCAAMRALYEILNRELGSIVKIFPTLYAPRDFGLLDVVHPQVSKGTGVAAVAAELGVKAVEVMAIGDNINDLEMLHFAGTAVVMDNAEPVLHEVPGFHVTASNDEDGVARAIEKFCLG
ncbi:MAG: Cof-type HAD-IIB family hydrolase [Pyrinomonadaceae bacterium]